MRRKFIDWLNCLFGYNFNLDVCTIEYKFSSHSTTRTRNVKRYFSLLHLKKIESGEKYLIIDKRCVTHGDTMLFPLFFFVNTASTCHWDWCVTDRVRKKEGRSYCSRIHHSLKLILSHRVEVNRLSYNHSVITSSNK